MAPTPWSTHMIEFGPDTVTKRFRPGCRERCIREWRALTLLAAHAPGTAPVPLSVDFNAAEPVVVMSRLDGEPLRGRALGLARTRALTRTVAELHTALPTHLLDRVPPRPGRPRAVEKFVHTWAPLIRPGLTGDVARAVDEGLARAAHAAREDSTERLPLSVFGPGDGNLANYLWDGSRVCVVDFEDSGRSDRAFELAEITEHVGSWVEQPLDVAAFLRGFDLTSTESSRLRECRRLLALVWLVLLSRDAKGERRNPPGTVNRQAHWLTGLLQAGA